MNDVSRETQGESSDQPCVSVVPTAEVPREDDSVARQYFGDRWPLADTYADLLCTTGVSHGLVGPREGQRIWSRHILNCAVIHELMPYGSSVIDIGSGAGLPGLPLAIMRPDLAVTLVEPLERRVVWLRHVVDALELPVAVEHARAEECAGRLVADIVTSRAVTRIDQLLRWCLPVMTSDGSVVAIKGQSVHDEIVTATKGLRKLKISTPEILTCGTDETGGPTTVVRVRRRGAHDVRNV